MHMHMHRIWIGVLTFTTLGCDQRVPVDDTVPVTRFDLAGQQTTYGDELVDLRSDSAVYMFHTRAPSWAPSEIDLICPNGVQMPLDAWLEAQEEALGFDITRSDDGRFMLSAVQPDLQILPVDPMPEGDECECMWSCFLCSDGAFICTSDCDPPQEWASDWECTEMTLGAGDDGDEDAWQSPWLWPPGGSWGEDNQPPPGWSDPPPDADGDGKWGGGDPPDDGTGSSGSGSSGGGSSSSSGGSSGGSSSGSGGSGYNSQGNSTPKQP